MPSHRCLPGRRRALCAAALTALSPSALSGCAQRPPGGHGRAAARAAVRITPPADPALGVRLSPLYREAERDCRAHRYLPAAAALRRLGDSPGLTPEQAAFCREQRAICLRDAGQPAPPPPAAPFPVASIATPALRPDQADCGPRALTFVCARLHRPASLPALRSAAGTTGRGTTLSGLALAARSVGLKARGEQVDLPALERLSGPAVAWVDGDHYLAVLKVEGETATIHDPNHPREEETPTRALLARSGGVLLTLAR